SAQTALTYARVNARHYHIDPRRFDRTDVHIHIPAGAIPKDGPSAGIALVTAIISAFTGRPVSREVAMTGEVTLRGNVLPIGGLKEKLLAALRGGITTVLIPKDNVKDLRDIPDNVKNGLTILPVADVTEVLATALTEMPTAIEWDEAAEEAAQAAAAAKSADLGAAGAATH
ncbi:MAG: S16 family serine protease, partial [Pseudomonadota bacterium]